MCAGLLWSRFGSSTDLGKWLRDHPRRWPHLRDGQRQVLLSLRIGLAIGARRVTSAGVVRVPRAPARNG
ncbi:hypothetical protein [Streptomyces sp. MNP-20]|uniref:hypothetical protein n=1 Tax=Streptomyces sp. MNP-20 TaxID=2721165 RepID=UPI001554CCD5|nr:hypothetical protein [Streptomyces sp. MNP-20]